MHTILEDGFFIIINVSELLLQQVAGTSHHLCFFIFDNIKCCCKALSLILWTEMYFHYH
jgi:hypothetical protein